MAKNSGNTIIESLGVYLPPRAVATKDIIQSCKNRLLYPLERLTGIRWRRMAGEEEFSIDLAKKAIETCFSKSQYGPADIDVLICCNISRYDGPNFEYSFEPSTSVRLKKHFGFDNALVFDVSNACAGMFTALNIIDGFLKSGFARRGMVVSGEYITHLTKTAQQEIKNDADERVACLTLGDSGVAMILEEAPNNEVGFHEIDLFTLGRYSHYCIARPTKEEHGGAIMFTEARKLHAVAIDRSVRHLIQVLRKLHWRWQSFQHFIMHQTANVAIAETARQVNSFFRKEVLGRTKMIVNLANRGNTSTTTHFLALWDNILNNKIRSRDKVVFAIQASGITVGTAPYTLDDLPDRLREMAVKKVSPNKAPAELRPSTPVDMGTPRVRLESIGTVVPDEKRRVDAVSLARMAGEHCFSRSKYSRNDINLLIHAGVHRDDFVCEPAIAAMVAGALHCNDAITVKSKGEKKTFAFDVFNGAVGFLNACYTAACMIKAQKFKTVMVVASEIENNAETRPDALLGINETGSAVIMDESEDDRTGFGRFLFRYFTDHIDAFRSRIGQENGTNFLSFTKDPEIENYYLDCIPKAVRELLTAEGLEMSQIKAVFPPQISPMFVDGLRQRISGIKDKIIDIADNGKDYFTSSAAYALQVARDRNLVQAGDIGLIINVGTGIQVGCATYYF